MGRATRRSGPGRDRVGQRAGFSWLYRSGRQRSLIAIGGLALVMAMALLQGAQLFGGFGILERAGSGLVNMAELESYEATAQIISWAYLAAIIVAGVAFLAWLSRSVDNSPSLGTGTPEIGPRWAIGWWFVPIASFWKPYQVVQDLDYRMSADAAPRSRLVTAWWLAFIGGGIAALVIGAMPGPTDLEGASTALTVALGLNVVQALGALLGILVVRRIQGMADLRAASLDVRAEEPAAVATA